VDKNRDLEGSLDFPLTVKRGSEGSLDIPLTVFSAKAEGGFKKV
jgi:hypothetical protein